MRWILPVLAFLTCSMAFVNCKKVGITSDNVLTVEKSTNKVNLRKPPPKIKKNGVKDIDGNKYSTVIIDGKEWMAENLIVAHYQNGDPITNIRTDLDWENATTGGWCDFLNLSPTVYGKFYNWFAVNDSRGLAPKGWHVATFEEMASLAALFSTSEQSSQYFYFFRGASPALKSTGTVEEGTGLWNENPADPSVEGTNASGFTGLPGGRRTPDGGFGPYGREGYWWSSTNSDVERPFSMVLTNENTDARVIAFAEKMSGFSVRCVKDEKK